VTSVETCDVLIVGGGPAGSSCARLLTTAGFEVIVLDSAVFPRNKPCAGWITLPLFSTLRLPAEEYAQGRVLQPITGFQTAIIGDRRPVTTRYSAPVSYAIRRTEFDAFLLSRSGARLHQGTPARTIEREAAGGWIVNGRFRAPVIVGAGGHFCPVARALRPERAPEPVVAAREIEFRLDAAQQAACPVRGDTPELYFTADLAGYGWLVRKDDFLNVGFGRIGAARLAGDLEAFVGWVSGLGRLPAGTPQSWPGHAYLLWETTPRRPVADAALLVGDAAGLAASASGEGIRPAVESGLMAAETLIGTKGVYRQERLEAYERRLTARFGPRSPRPIDGRPPSRLRQAVARQLLRSAWFTRHLLLDRWFLQRKVPAL